jgi:preprotein translocase subunit SecF|tara:strand:- start:313 stop:1224 length:912 start_codon:yes stop_codon:yes gene_type:complete
MDLTNIGFMKIRRQTTVLSIILIVISIYSLFVNKLNFGLDFTGGSLIEIRLAEDIDSLEDIRGLLQSMNLSDFQVNYFGSNRDISIKVPGGDNSIDEDVLIQNLKQDFDFEVRRQEFVGPQVGSELRDQGGLGLLAALAVMMVYIMFRFQYKFALGALLALVHDVVIVLGFFSFFSLDFDLSVLAAILAVIGYSLNDTIVVSDRVRENFRKKRRSNSEIAINRSLSQMIGRTLITSLTTLLVLIALLIFGGETISNFSIALIVGVISGTYSSIYIVCNTLLTLKVTSEDLMIRKTEVLDDGMP